MKGTKPGLTADGLKDRARKWIQDALDTMQKQGFDRSQFESAIDRIAPLVKVGGFKRGGRNVLYPKPLTQRQSRRIAIDWVADAASKKKSRQRFGERIGTELVGVLQDNSALLQKREMVHKQAVANRSNLILSDRKKK
ncbi:hypothetical protein HDV03_000269 [Kappamyces sp. JEL0829]|nr:hypothetical protein HDV03_000269 [Kappamyces sp. JEL0829]KAJ3358314.1 hypothetical protein HDU91_005256 [Kappamyces sp. JEL0680]